MSDFQAIADRVEIEALRGEFTDAVLMRDYESATPTARSVCGSSAAIVWLSTATTGT